MPTQLSHHLAQRGAGSEHVFAEYSGCRLGVFFALVEGMRQAQAFSIARHPVCLVLRLRLSLHRVAVGIACLALIAGCSAQVQKTAPLTDAATTTDSATTGCRSSADCTQGTNGASVCIAPQQPWFCGPVEQVGASCTSDTQCGGGSVCREILAPDGGVDSGGKVCSDASCTDDSQCPSGQVCRKDFTTRVPDELICAPPCVTGLGCAPTDTCDNSGHCRARTCAECPSYYSCASGTCVIPSCSTDNDCPGGYCVAMFSGTGSCSGTLGSCRMICF
jgi:hypothetical protein